MPRLQVTVVQGRNLAGTAEDNDLCALSLAVTCVTLCILADAKIKVCSLKQVHGVETHTVLKKFKTNRIPNSRDPVWMETFTITIPHAHRKGSPLTIEVVDYNRFSPNTVVGQAPLQFGSLRKGEETACWLPLREGDQETGEVFVRLLALDFNGARSASDAPAYCLMQDSRGDLPAYTPSHSPPAPYERPPTYEETESPCPSAPSSPTSPARAPTPEPEDSAPPQVLLPQHPPSGTNLLHATDSVGLPGGCGNASTANPSTAARYHRGRG